MAWHSPLLLLPPSHPWWIDATRMGIPADDLASLPWPGVFAEMAALEEGAVANPDEDRQVGHYWLRAPELAPTIGQAKAIGTTHERVRDFAAQVRDGDLRAPNGLRFTHLLHVGIGGSALGPQLLIDALPGQGLQPHFLDNTDPDGIAHALAALGPALAQTLVLVVSKSGGTVETANALDLVVHACQDQGLPAAGRLVAITGEGSKLHQRAEKEGWLRTFPMWDWVGGRTSVTSAVGLLPAELVGIDTQALLSGAREMDAWTRQTDPLSNPAAMLAGCWYRTGHGHGERAMVVLPYADRLVLMSRYLQQLVMESLGKHLDRQGAVVDQGITVYGNKGSTDQHAYVQQLRDGRDDFFVTFLQVLGDGDGSQEELASGTTAGDYLQGFLLGTRNALSERDRPSLTITVPQIDARVIGGLIALFERAVGLYASLIDVNAYHQPGVEAGKKAANAVIALSKALREHLRAGPAPLAALAEKTGAEATDVLYVLEHLVATHRLVRDGDIHDGSWRLPRGAER